MSAKESLHRLVDGLPEDQADLAQQILADLRDAADPGGEPLTQEGLASLDRGLDDIKAGRVKPLEQYERERGL